MSETNPLPPGRVHGLIMAGGGGTRFWPRSRQKLPKQFLTLQGDRSLLQQTADRIQFLIHTSEGYPVLLLQILQMTVIGLMVKV